MRDVFALGAALCVLGGCAGSSDDDSPFGTSSPGASDGGTDAGTSAGADGAEAGDGEDGGSAADGGEGPKFDTPDGNTGADDGVSGEGCEKVDFLFVIDNSVSMTDEQENLIASFPSFIDTIKDTLQAQDYQILVTDMDAADKWGIKYDKCVGNCMGEPPTDICSLGTMGTILCGDLPVPGPTECDQTLGSGRVYDKSVPPQYCPFEAGKRYLTEAQPDLSGTFECAASMGAWGGGEFAMGSMLGATSDALNGAGGCNEGFLRDDAVLVVTVITDEEDYMDSPGDPPSWKADLLARKGGNETAIVVLGLVGDTGLPDAVCPPDSMAGGMGGEYSPRLREFVMSFGARGFLGSVCEPDYGPFFQEAVDVIDFACDEFMPEG